MQLLLLLLIVVCLLVYFYWSAARIVSVIIIIIVPAICIWELLLWLLAERRSSHTPGLHPCVIWSLLADHLSTHLSRCFWHLLSTVWIVGFNLDGDRGGVVSDEIRLIHRDYLNCLHHLLLISLIDCWVRGSGYFGNRDRLVYRGRRLRLFH